MVQLDIHDIATTQDFTTPYFLECKRIISDTFHELEHYVRVPKFHILLEVGDPIPGMRTAGFCESEYLLRITVDGDEIRGIDDQLRSELRSTIIHETTHAIRNYYHPRGYGFQENIITEGLACLAEVEYGIPYEQIPYIQTTPDEINFLLKLVQQQDEDYNHDERFFGAGELPHWAGYKLAYHLIKSYADKYSKNIWQIIDMPASKIFEWIKK